MGQKKHLYSLCAGLLLVANLVLFLIFYIPNYVIQLESVAFDYFQYFFTVAMEFLIPCVIAFLLLHGAIYDGCHTVFLRALYLTLPRLIYLIPYYYLYMDAYGNDWVESISLSLLVSALGLLVGYLRALVLYYVGFFAVRKNISKRLFSELPPARQIRGDKEVSKEINKKVDAVISAEFSKAGLFDLFLPSTVGIFSIAFLEFAVMMLSEIYSVVVFVMEYGAFRTGELIYTVTKFAIIFIMLFVSHVLCHVIFRGLHKGEEKNANVQTLGE